MTLDEVMTELGGLGLPLICVTGGEPLEQEGCIPLLEALLENGYEVDLETNGSIDLRPVVQRAGRTFLSVDVKTPSSGMAGSFLMDNLELMGGNSQLKFVVKDQKDLDFTIGFLMEHMPQTDVIITPCGNMDGGALAGSLMGSLRSLEGGLGILRNRVRFMVQSQKVIWGPEMKGV